MSQSDLSAWIVAGIVRTRMSRRATTTAFGVSYSTQQYQNAQARAARRSAAAADDSRNVGEIFGSDRWTVVADAARRLRRALRALRLPAAALARSARASA